MWTTAYIQGAVEKDPKSDRSALFLMTKISMQKLYVAV